VCQYLDGACRAKHLARRGCFVDFDFPCICRQSLPEQWLSYTEEHVTNAHAVLASAKALRGRCSDALDNSASELRSQADRVDRSFQDNIAETERAIQVRMFFMNFFLSDVKMSLFIFIF